MSTPDTAGTAQDPTLPTACTEMIRQCELLCHAGSIQISGPDCMVTPSEGLISLLGLPPTNWQIGRAHV